MSDLTRRSLGGEGSEPPYADRHVRWCGTCELTYWVSSRGADWVLCHMNMIGVSWIMNVSCFFPSCFVNQ